MLYFVLSRLLIFVLYILRSNSIILLLLISLSFQDLPHSDQKILIRKYLRVAHLSYRFLNWPHLLRQLNRRWMYFSDGKFLLEGGLWLIVICMLLGSGQDFKTIIHQRCASILLHLSCLICCSCKLLLLWWWCHYFNVCNRWFNLARSLGFFLTLMQLVNCVKYCPRQWQDFDRASEFKLTGDLTPLDVLIRYSFRRFEQFLLGGCLLLDFFLSGDLSLHLRGPYHRKFEVERTYTRVLLLLLIWLSGLKGTFDIFEKLLDASTLELSLIVSEVLKLFVGTIIVIKTALNIPCLPLWQRCVLYSFLLFTQQLLLSHQQIRSWTVRLR